MSKKPYATREMHGGLDWRAISRVLKSDKITMSPTRARGLFMTMMEKFAKDVLIRTKGHCTQLEIKDLATDPNFQDGIGSILRLSEIDNGKNKRRT